MPYRKMPIAASGQPAQGETAMIAIAAQDSIDAAQTICDRFIRPRRLGIRKPANTAPTPITPNMNPNASGPSARSTRTSSGSSPQTAAPNRKKTQARMMADCIAGVAATNRTPARMAERKCSGGRARTGASRFHSSSAPASDRMHSALKAKAVAVPKPAMISPPTAGPSARAMLKPMPLSAMAPTKSSRGTSSGVVAAQPGKLIASPTPSAKVKASRPHGPSVPDRSITQSSSATAASHPWVSSR